MKLRALLLGVLSAFCVGGALQPLGAQSDQLDFDIRLFTVLAAINVAGYDQGFGSPSDHPVRAALRQDLAEFDGPIKTQLTNFYKQFEKRDPSETLSHYVSFALTCDGPPDFAVRAELPTDIPPDVRPLRPLSRILAEFYQDAGIERLWAKYQAAHEQQIASYQIPLVESLFEAAGYLRLSPTSREVQNFKIIFDLLAAPNQFNTRSYGGVVYAVVHPSKEPRIEEIRHAFLLHLLDPLSIRYAEEIGKKEELSRLALFAPALPEIYKSDFQLLATKSLAKAVEIRLSREPLAAKQAAAELELRQGFILTPYFFDALADYEAQSQILGRYYPELIKAINVKRESTRIQATQFDEKPARPQPGPMRPRLSPLDFALREAEFFLASDQFGKARRKFEEVLEKTQGGNSQALYGLARVAALDGDPDAAREYFLQVIELQEDPHLLAMSHVFIGRIDDLMGNREEAVAHYEAALAAGDPSETTQQLAREGLDRAFAPPGHPEREEESYDPDEDLFEEE